jgi:hypothetical protein
VLEFGHAGILYRDSFVMYDHQTDSLWVHATGRAEHGVLKGKQLTFMPSTVTTWDNWKKSYPHTTVLAGHRRGGFMGTYKGLGGTRRIGLAVVVRFKGKLYPFGVLQRRPVVNDLFNGSDLVIYYSQRTGTAIAWRRTVDGTPLIFHRSSRKDAQGHTLLRDEETGSHWAWLTGEAVDGSLKGKKLERAMYNPILNDRFKAFYPDAPIYEGG